MNSVQKANRKSCALLGFYPSKSVTENFMTTDDVVKEIRASHELPALLKPRKLLGDYDVSAGEEGTPEVTKKYLCQTPGQVCEDGIPLNLNTIVQNVLKETHMDTSYNIDNGGKLKSFNEFPVGRTDLDDVAIKASTPAIVSIDFRGNVTHQALAGTSNGEVPRGATTVEMNGAKERALKRMAEFISSYHGNNQPTIYTKETA